MNETSSTLQDSRPGLAIIANVLTPYRVHLHSRIVTEIPEYRLHSLLTHSHTEFRWQLQAPQSINVVSFAESGRSARSNPLRHAWSDWAKAGRILSYLQTHQVKAVILMGYADATRLRLLGACRSRGLPIFLRADSNILGDRLNAGAKSWLKKAIVSHAVRKATAVMPMGQMGRAYFERYGAKEFFIVPYEPDYSQFQTVGEQELQEFAEKNGLDRSRRRLIYSGRLTRIKRVDLVLEGYIRIAEARQEWDLVIAGDGPERGALEAIVPEGLRSRVKWLGFCEMASLRCAYRLCDVLVHASEYEPWALVIQEAMAAGLIVISSDVVGAAHEMVRPGVNGELFKSGNLENLVEKLLKVTDADQMRGYRDCVPGELAAYRRRCDPVTGIKLALRSVGLLG